MTTTTNIPKPPFTRDQLRALSARDLRRVYDLYPDAVGSALAVAAEQDRKKAPTIVGYWRPLKVWDGSSTETIDAPDSSGLRSALRYLEDCRAGRHVSRYVSDDDLRRAGVETHVEYWEAEVARARAEAEAEFALPVPVPGSLSEEQAAVLAAWLEGGREVSSYRGSSVCRVCGCSNGVAELQRDGFRYPSGLVHYVRDHRVAVPGLEGVL